VASHARRLHPRRAMLNASIMPAAARDFKHGLARLWGVAPTGGTFPRWQEIDDDDEDDDESG